MSSRKNNKPPSFLLLASFSDSILLFRKSLLQEILKKGYALHVAAPGLSKDSNTRLSLEGMGVIIHDIPLSRTGTNPASDLTFLFHLYLLLRNVKPSTILSYTIKPVIYGTLAAWLAFVPNRYALITGLGYTFTGSSSGLLSVLVKHMYRLALKRVQKVFFQNPDDEHLFRQMGLLKEETPSVVVNGSGVDVASFTQVSVPEGAPYFLLIARLLGDKGVREYAQAAQRIKSKYPNIMFFLVGWIDENPDAISQNELDSWINSGILNYLGRLQDVRPAISQCSVYVLPSYREGTPRTVLEAMAMGRPIITTNAPGCRETVIDGENGFLVPVQSTDALVEAMLRFIDDPTLVRRMGKRSREIAEDKYDVHKVNAVMLREMELT